MLKKQVAELNKVSIENHSKNKELEECVRRLCLRVDDIPAENNESSDDVMNLSRSLFKEAKVSVRKIFWIVPIESGLFVLTELAKKMCKSIIVRFITFRHRTQSEEKSQKCKSKT